MSSIPDRFAEILDSHVVAHLATINPDGSPQVSPIWLEREGEILRFGTAEGRAKLRNLRNDGRLAVSFTDPDAPSTSYSIRGRVTSIGSNGWDLIDRLCLAYRGEDRFPRIEGMVRVDVEFTPHSFYTNH